MSASWVNAKGILLALATLLYCAGVRSVRAQTNYQRIKSLGGSPGQSPLSPLIQGSDGVLYGTTYFSDGPGNGKIFRINKDGTDFAVLKSFTGRPEGRNPRAGLLEASDHTLYGTTSRGGSNDVGTVFKIQKDGTGFATLYSFSSFGQDGRTPYAALTEASDGLLYGTTYEGGTNSGGTIYTIHKDGSGYSIIHHLGGSSEGFSPLYGVHEASDGALYGCASGYYGTVFKLNKNGSGFSVLHTFPDGGGERPTDVMEGSDGRLYGTTIGGGTGSGAVFRLNKDGSNFTLIHSFSTATNGRNPQAGLVEGPDGALYGTTLVGGLENTGGLSSGAVFKLNKDGTGFSAIKYFTGSTHNGDAYYPVAALVQGVDGMLYGTTRFGGTADLGAIFKLSTNGDRYQVAFSFGPGECSAVFGGLIEGPDGMLYGTAFYSPSGGAGSVFKVAKDGHGFTNLHPFGSVDARYPRTSLVLATNGMLYGTGSFGGTNDYGAIFTISTNGTGYAVLHSFAGNAADGGWPYGELLSASDGVLYGTTELVGPGNSSGTVFSLHTDGGHYTVLHNFTGIFNGSTDGGAPYAGLIEASNGLLFGTTASGGTNNKGTIFKLSKNGSGYSVVYSFSGTNGDGANPRSRLLQASDGRLYGTAEVGGQTNIVSKGAGTIFRIDQNGTGYETVYCFSGGSDGANPYAGLTEGTNHALYGTSFSGGANNGGTIFRLGMDGTGFTVLHDLTGTEGDGQNPYGRLVQGSDGALYGTTFSGGDTNLGTLFKLHSVAPATKLTRVSLTTNGANVLLTGAAWKQQLVLQTRTDLLTNASWQTIATNAANVDGTSQFLDAEATNLPARFYRTRAL